LTASLADLVTAATVGLSRRPAEITALTGAAADHAGVIDAADPAAALLDAAALYTVASRAGIRPTADVARPAPAPEETEPELPVRAANLLLQAAPDQTLLAALLTAAGRAGYRLPAPLLPALLDAAVRSKALRPAVASVLGARGRWLAAYRPDWQRVPSAASALDASPEADDGPAPFSPAEAAATMSALTQGAIATPRPDLPRDLLAIAARRLPVADSRDHAAELHQLAAKCPAPWSVMLTRAADTIALRRAFHEEIR
jgi:hypothetical protein